MVEEKETQNSRADSPFRGLHLCLPGLPSKELYTALGGRLQVAISVDRRCRPVSVSSISTRLLWPNVV